MVELTWKGDVASEIKIRDHIVTTDSNSDEGGRNLGPAPTELFLAALGGCIMINASRIVKKMRIELKNVRMRILGIKEQNDRPSSFVQLNVDAAVDADAVDRARLEKPLRLAEADCTVSNTLRDAVASAVRLVWGE
jgi:putative redox protein